MATDNDKPKARCHVCSKGFTPRYNIGRRVKTCTPTGHKCKMIKKGRKNVCEKRCCRSRYRVSASKRSAGSSIDSRKFLSGEEFSSFGKATYKLKYSQGVVLRFIAATGCRLGESLLVRPDDLRLDEKPPAVRIVTLKQEGRPVYPVHIHYPKAVKELRILGGKAIPGQPLFSCSKRTLQRKLVEIFDDLNIRSKKDGAVHILRHTHASNLAALGYSLVYISEQLRHSSVEMAAIYTHADVREIIKKSKGLPKLAP